MSKQIDPTNITTDEEARYLADRPWMIEEFKRQGFHDEMAAIKDGVVVRPSPEDETRVTTDQMRVGTQVPQQINPRNNGVTGDPDDDEVDDDYESWSKAELEAEIDERNKEDRPKLSKTGNKEELAKRLHEDDATMVSPSEE